MRLVHAADLHLDSPLRGLARLGDDAVATQLRSASRQALANLVDLVIKEQVPVLLLAGDIYDGDWHDYSTGRCFVREMDRLDQAGVRVFMVAGNHDAASEITRSLHLPGNVTVMDTESSQRVVADDLGLAVHGRGFATRIETRNLAAEYQARVPGMVNVGLLHTSVDGAEGHARYAPCHLSDLLAPGYEYFALGHVHERRVLVQGEHTVAYSGNLQGRHAREPGAKGALLVDLEPGQEANIDFRPLDVTRWASVEVPCDQCRGLDEAIAAAHQLLGSALEAAAGRLLVARVIFTGSSPAACELVDSVRVNEEVSRIGATLGVTVEKTQVRVTTPSGSGRPDDELLAALLGAGQTLLRDHHRIRSQLRELEAEVGRDLREAELLDLGDPQLLRGLAEQAMAALRARLAGGNF